jgi:hypothetical protein
MFSLEHTHVNLRSAPTVHQIPQRVAAANTEAPNSSTFNFQIRKHSLFSSVTKPLSIHSPGSLLSKCELPRVEDTYAHQGIVSIQIPK